MSEYKSNASKYVTSIICSINECERHPTVSRAHAESDIGIKLMNYIRGVIRVRDPRTGHVKYYRLPKETECFGCPFEVIVGSDELNTLLLETTGEYPVIPAGKVIHSQTDQSVYILFTPEDADFKTDNLIELSICSHNTATRCMLLGCDGFCPDLFCFEM
jgi:hypothetical protein